MHLSLYLNEIDLEGMIYTSSKFYFQGDGEHRLKEINLNYRCMREDAWNKRPIDLGKNKAAGNLKSYRPFEEGWIESL